MESETWKKIESTRQELAKIQPLTNQEIPNPAAYEKTEELRIALVILFASLRK